MALEALSGQPVSPQDAPGATEGDALVESTSPVVEGVQEPAKVVVNGQVKKGGCGCGGVQFPPPPTDSQADAIMQARREALRKKLEK